MNPSEIFLKGAAKKMNSSDFFFSKGVAKTLRGRNPAIFRGGAGKKWNVPMFIL